MSLEKVRVILLLPDLGREVEFRTLSSRDALETGIMPLINRKPTQEELDADADLVIAKAGEVCCQCSVSPKIVRREIPSSENNVKEISLDDLTNLDKMFVLNQIVPLSHSRFYGVNRRAFDPQVYEGLIRAQQHICYLYDLVCQRYSISPLEVFRWTNEELSYVLAMMDGADAFRKTAEQKNVTTEEENVTE